MRSLVGTIVLLLFFVLPADAQPVGLWEHRFVEHTVYLRIEPPILEVWRVNDRGGCMMMPSTIRWDEGSVVHGSGTRWGIDQRSDTLTVALPDTTLEYRRTDATPRKRCDEPKKI